MIKNVSKKLPSTNADLPKLIAKNFLFLHDWADQNGDEFTFVMHRLADQNPAKYAEVFVKMMQILAAQAKVPAEITVQHTVTDDIDALRNLSGQREGDVIEINEAVKN